MNSESNNSESSLPTQAVQAFPSSPPILQESEVVFEKLKEMDNSPHFKSEPPPKQIDEASRPSLKRVSSEDTERPPSAQQLHRDSDEHDEEEDDDDDLDADPAEKMIDFDWAALHQQYHDAIKGCHEVEGELAQEWENLMNYFRIWAESGHDHETDRTYQRLRTRTIYVQNSEVNLEKTRNHYIDVVKAFESALNLLKAHGFGR